MVRKAKEPANPEQNALVDAVFTSAQQIWVAGLGAFARAQKEGSELFDKLVQEGGELQKLTERLKPDKGYSPGGTISKLAENVSRQASGSWDKLEKIFEDRVARALRSLGVPSHDDVQALQRQVEELKQMVATQMQAPKPAARKSAAKSAAKPPGKPAAKLAAKGAALKGGARAAAKRQARPASH